MSENLKARRTYLSNIERIMSSRHLVGTCTIVNDSRYPVTHRLHGRKLCIMGGKNLL